MQRLIEKLIPFKDNNFILGPGRIFITPPLGVKRKAMTVFYCLKPSVVPCLVSSVSFERFLQPWQEPLSINCLFFNSYIVIKVIVPGRSQNYLPVLTHHKLTQLSWDALLVLQPETKTQMTHQNIKLVIYQLY